jgi:hypothetical protein
MTKRHSKQSNSEKGSKKVRNLPEDGGMENKRRAMAFRHKTDRKCEGPGLDLNNTGG